MKIGLLNHFLSRNSGGVFEVSHRLSTELNAIDSLEAVLVGLADDRSKNDLLTIGSRHAIACNVHGPKGLGFSPALFDVLDHACLDVLHVHGLWMYPSVASMRWMAKKRTGIISPHGMLDPWALRNSRWKKIIASALYERRHLRSAACLHALCEPEREAIWSLGLKNSVAIIPNGVDIPSARANTPWPWPGSVPRGSKVLLSLGRLHPKKNLLELLRAWAIVESEHDLSDDWWLVVAGWDQGGYRGRIQTLAKELGLKRFFLDGPKFGLDKDSVFRNSEAFILPSLSEGLPMAILEAWSYEKPVLMTPACNLADGFEVNAAISLGSNPKALHDGIRTLILLKDRERMDMGVSGLELVKQRYSWRQVAQQYASLYQWICGGGPCPPEVVSG